MTPVAHRPQSGFAALNASTRGRSPFPQGAACGHDQVAEFVAGVAALAFDAV
jgi:hypothetical protein